MPSRQPTQADVARRAGVSRTTVSLVLNGHVGERVPISEATRQRVLQTLREVGYAPNAAAQMLARGRNQLIGVFTYEPRFPYESEDFYHPYLLGIEREASRRDYDLLLFTRQRSAGQRGIYNNGTNSLSLADGTILIGPHPERDELRRLADEGYPFVFIGRREVPGREIDWVTSDYTSASAEATLYLLKLGHRRIAFAGRGPETESYRDRLTGCRLAAETVPGAEILIVPDSVLGQPQDLAETIRQLGVTATLVAEWPVGQGLLQEAHLRVPDEQAVIVLADEVDSPTSSLTHTVLNRQMIGEEAVRLLINRLNGTASEPQQVRIPCQFVIGTSTGAPVTR